MRNAHTNGHISSPRSSNPNPQSPVDQVMEENIYVTHVDSPTCFWAQSADLETTQIINKMSADLQIYCKNKPLLQTVPLLNKIYGGIYSEDNQWYRCRIKEMLDEVEIMVHFIDYGNTEVISKRSLVFLSQDLLSPPPFSQFYCLEGFSAPKETSDLFQEGLHYFQENLTNRITRVKRTARRRSPEIVCPVELMDSIIGDVGMEMERQGFISRTKHTPPPLVSPMSTPIRQSPPLSSPTTGASPAVHTSGSKRSPPLSSPTPRNLMHDMNNNCEHLSKENTVLRESVKGLEQLVDNMKKKMEHSVTSKFQKLISEAANLRNLRISYPTEDKLDVIGIAISQVQEKKTITNLKLLDKVKTAENSLSAAQEAIKNCTDQDVLSELIPTRNKVHQEFSDTIGEFLLHMESLPLDARLVDLQVSLGRLTVHSSAKGVSSDGSGVIPSTDEAIKAYKTWMERSLKVLSEVQTDTVQNCAKVCKGLEKVLQLLSSDCADYDDIGDLDAMINSHLTAIQREAEKTKLIVAVAGQDITEEDRQIVKDDEGDAVRCSVIKALVTEISKEVADIKELRESLHHYKNFKDELDSHLSCEPDVTKVAAARKCIKSLRSKLRHKLADKQDLEESDEDCQALQEVEESLSKLYQQLHQSYLEEQRELDVLAKLAEYMPELAMLHPELGLTLFMATNGLVKVGWEVDHFPNYGTQAWTEFNGEPCLLKKYRLDDAKVTREEFEKQAVRYSQISHPRLIKLQALFYDKSKRKAFVQTPYYRSLEDWLESFPEEKELMLVSGDILEAVNTLHSHGVTHGAVNEDTVRITQSGGVTRAVLANPDFTKPNEHNEGVNRDNNGNIGFSLISQDLDSAAALRGVLESHAKARPTTPQPSKSLTTDPEVVTPMDEKKSVAAASDKNNGCHPDMPLLQPIDETEELQEHLKVAPEKGVQLEEKQNGI